MSWWKPCIKFSLIKGFQENSPNYRKLDRIRHKSKPPNNVFLKMFHPLNFKEALIKSSYWLVWICKNLNSLSSVFECLPQLPFLIFSPSLPVSSLVNHLYLSASVNLLYLCSHILVHSSSSSRLLSHSQPSCTFIFILHSCLALYVFLSVQKMRRRGVFQVQTP